MHDEVVFYQTNLFNRSWKFITLYSSSNPKSNTRISSNNFCMYKEIAWTTLKVYNFCIESFKCEYLQLCMYKFVQFNRWK